LNFGLSRGIAPLGHVMKMSVREGTRLRWLNMSRMILLWNLLMWRIRLLLDMLLNLLRWFNRSRMIVLLNLLLWWGLHNTCKMLMLLILLMWWRRLCRRSKSTGTTLDLLLLQYENFKIFSTHFSSTCRRWWRSNQFTPPLYSNCNKDYIRRVPAQTDIFITCRGGARYLAIAQND
jgi:hypothetical protein